MLHRQQRLKNRMLHRQKRRRLQQRVKNEMLHRQKRVKNEVR
jgi:hypothetical protein